MNDNSIPDYCFLQDSSSTYYGKLWIYVTKHSMTMIFYLHTMQSFLCTKRRNNTFLAAEDILTHIHWLNKEFLLTHLGFPDSSVGKESACNAGDPGLIPGSERSAGEWIGYTLQYSWASLVAQLVKILPAMWETWVQSLGREDPLEKGKAAYSSILAWRIPWTLESVGLQSQNTFNKYWLNVDYTQSTINLMGSCKIIYYDIIYLCTYLFTNGCCCQWFQQEIMEAALNKAHL